MTLLLSLKTQEDKVPNTFGTSTLSFPLVDSACIREHRGRFRRDMFPEIERANSYYSLSDRWPDQGWILLDRKSYDQLIGSSLQNQYNTNFQLVIQDFLNPSIVIDNLSIVQARCVTRGLASDPNAIYLIQLTNMIGVIYNPWFQFPVNTQYNVRVPAYDTQYYSWSLNSGTTWTWDTLLQDLWNKAPTQLGSYPSLPITPAGVPENFIFTGVPLWEAINRILDYLGLSVVGNYPSFSLVVSGAADSTFTTLQTNSVKFLEDDMEYIDGGSGRVPSSVVVYFHRRNQIYGTEETVRYDSFNWQNNPLYSVTIPAPSKFTNASGTAYLISNQTVRFDEDNNPLAADVTLANAIAQERVTQYFNTIFRGTKGFMRQVYGGLIDFSTGSLVDGVRWYNYGYRPDEEYNKKPYGGWRTEIIRGYMWEEVTFPTTNQGLTGPV